MGTAVIRSFRVFGLLLQKAGPYVLLEVLLPGGTLFALMLLAYRRRQASAIGAAVPRAHVEGLGRIRAAWGALMTRRSAPTPRPAVSQTIAGART